MIVFDSGAVIKSERNDPKVTAIVEAARKGRNEIVLPATVIAQTWRGQATDPRTARLFKDSIDRFLSLDEREAKAVGALLGTARTDDVVDGHVVYIAIKHAPSAIVTSDADDMERILAAAGFTYARENSPQADGADVLIIPV